MTVVPHIILISLVHLTAAACTMHTPQHPHDLWPLCQSMIILQEYTESCDCHVTMVQDHPSSEEFCDYTMQSSVPHDSHVTIETVDWLTEMKNSIPELITNPCKISLRLNVNDSPDTFTKLSQLLDCLSGECNASCS